MAGRYYAACAPSWHVPRGRRIEWVLAYLVVLDGFCQCMTMVPVIGAWCWLAGLFVTLLAFTLAALLVRFRR